ncbi:MAG: hypothetical protein JW705_08600 [Methanosarcinaceae archaeon]|nr:hypothetical protein [Methanosarcinaceae archaeon]
MLNSSVSLGRAGAEVFLLTEFADDEVGKMIDGFLQENRVSTEYVSVYKGRRSSLALAFLNSRNDAVYSFYEDLPEKRTLKEVKGLWPDDIVMFSSILAVSGRIRPQLKALLNSAKRAGSTIIYDPNLRPAHVRSSDVKGMLRENVGYAGIVRASDEDMMNIGGIRDADGAYEHVCYCGCRCLVYTAGSKGVHLRTPSLSKHYAVPELSTVSTIGAGDSFNAGIVHQLLREAALPADPAAIPEAAWDRIIGMGIGFASDVCQGHENYISESLACKMTGFSSKPVQKEDMQSNGR